LSADPAYHALRIANTFAHTKSFSEPSGYRDFDSQQHFSKALFVILQTNLPSLTVQQHDFTSLPVSVQTIFFAEAAKPIGAIRKPAATNAKIACFILVTSFLSFIQPRETEVAGKESLLYAIPKRGLWQ
jgi:hypothetical protein